MHTCLLKLANLAGVHEQAVEDAPSVITHIEVKIFCSCLSKLGVIREGFDGSGRNAGGTFRYPGKEDVQGPTAYLLGRCSPICAPGFGEPSTFHTFAFPACHIDELVEILAAASKRLQTLDSNDRSQNVTAAGAVRRCGEYARFNLLYDVRRAVQVRESR